MKILKKISILFALLAMSAITANAQSVTIPPLTIVQGLTLQYTINTVGVPDGAVYTLNWCTSSGGSAGAPSGVTSGPGVIFSNIGMLVINTATTTPPGTYYFRLMIGSTAVSNIASLTVTAPAVSDIAIKEQPRLTYSDGQSLDLSGLEVTLTYSNGTKEDVTFSASNFSAKDISATPVHGTVLTIAHHSTSIVVYCNGHGAYTEPLTVTPAVSGIAIKEQPRLTYSDGQPLDLSGLEVTLTYSNGTKEDVTFSPSNFSAKGISATPVHGTVLTRAFDGVSIVVYCNGHGAYTETLTVTAAPTTYTVTVNSGTGSGSYEAGATVDISANTPAAGKEFDQWTASSADVTFADKYSANTSFSMPATDVTVEANYRDVTYIVTVVNGTGSGNYEEGEKVDIVAGAAPANNKFDRWTTTSAGVTFADENAKETSFMMPANDVTVEANYRDATGIGEIGETVETGELKAWVYDGTLYVSGLTAGQPWRVYNVMGTLIYRAAANANEITFPLPVRGIYIVSDGITTVKVVN